MNLLCFDVTGPIGSIAVFKDGRCVNYIENPEKRTHASLLIPLLEQALAKSDLTYQDLDALVTCVGPGSFTGIRIGLAAAKGFQIATQKPVIGLTSFSLSHWKCRRFMKDLLPVAVVIDALREDVYCQLFHPNGSSVDPKNLEITAIPPYVGHQKFILTGSALAQVDQALVETKAEILRYPDLYTAQDLGEFALSLSLNEFKKLAHIALEPFYLRPPDITLKPVQ